MDKDKKRRYVVEPAAALRDALALIEENNHRSVIVAKGDGTVVGTLSDGDARKAILDGRMLHAPVSDLMTTDFISLRPAKKGEAKAIFKRTHIFLIPVVDARMRLVDILEAY
ncbi:MAG: CBS domain-containing protein [Elusimicrobia bacterium]|nr:CBS domain-containing protein [Elusimicrobiota bacterium]